MFPDAWKMETGGFGRYHFERYPKEASVLRTEPVSFLPSGIKYVFRPFSHLFSGGGIFAQKYSELWMIIFALCGREYVCREGTDKLQKEESLKGKRRV